MDPHLRGSNQSVRCSSTHWDPTGRVSCHWRQWPEGFCSGTNLNRNGRCGRKGADTGGLLRKSPASLRLGVTQRFRFPAQGHGNSNPTNEFVPAKSRDFGRLFYVYRTTIARQMPREFTNFTRSVDCMVLAGIRGLGKKECVCWSRRLTTWQNLIK